jgi:hypothetical protein
MPTIEVKLNLSDKIIEYLRYAAAQRGVSIDDIVSEVVQAYFDDLTDDDEESEETS